MGKKRKRTSSTNKRAEQATADLIDPRLTRAIAHPLRLQILAHANQVTTSPSEYSEETGAPLSSVSYHFRKLAELGFIELVEEVPKRGSQEHRYRGCRRGLVTDADWKLLGKTTQAGVRIAGFQDLITRCTQAVQAGTFDSRDDAIFYWVAGGMDEAGWEEFIAAAWDLISKVKEIEVSSTQRMAENGGKCFPTTFGITAFESPENKKRRTGKAKRGGERP